MQGPLITFFVTGNAMLIWKRRKGEKASHNETSISALEGKNYALPDPMLGNFENLLSRNTALGSVKWKTLIWNLICKISRMLSQNLMKINAELVTGLSNQLLIKPNLIFLVVELWSQRQWKIIPYHYDSCNSKGRVLLHLSLTYTCNNYVDSNVSTCMVQLGLIRGLMIQVNMPLTGELWLVLSNLFYGNSSTLWSSTTESNLNRI